MICKKVNSVWLSVIIMVAAFKVSAQTPLLPQVQIGPVPPAGAASPPMWPFLAGGWPSTIIADPQPSISLYSGFFSNPAAISTWGFAVPTPMLSSIASPSGRDLVINSDHGEDLILTTLNSDGGIRFGTMRSGQTIDSERVSIWNSGHLSINGDVVPADWGYSLFVNGGPAAIRGGSLPVTPPTQPPTTLPLPATLSLIPNTNGTHWCIANTNDGGKFVISMGNAFKSGLVPRNDNTDWSVAQGTALMINNNGQVGIHTDDASSGMLVVGGGENNRAIVAESGPSSNVFLVPQLGAGGYNSLSKSGSKGIIFTNGMTSGTANPVELVIAPHTNDLKAGLVMNELGNIGIGCTPSSLSDNKLLVDGSIFARELTCTNVSPFPDYVFDSTYKLMSLADLRAEIDENHKLPGLPSADQVKREGLKVADIQTKVVEKIEELTLYILQQEERLKVLERENEQLKRIVQSASH